MLDQTDKRCQSQPEVAAAGVNRPDLRVILLDDGETVHNAFFDRGFREE